MKQIESLSQTSIKLLLSEPFYGHFMMSMAKELSDVIKTAGIALMNNDSIKLVVNPKYWDSLSGEHQYGLLKHEILHVVLKHVFIQKEYPNKKLFNIAADLVVNQYILEKQLPKGSIKLHQFRYLEHSHGIVLERDKDVGYYYRMLDLACKSNCCMSFSAACLCMGGKSSSGKSGSGKSGSNESKQNSENAQLDLEKLMQENCEAFERHKFWHSFDELSKGARKICEYQCNQLIQQTVNRVKYKTTNYGNLPAGLISLLNAILQGIVPKFNWRRVLRLFATTSNSSYIKNTIRKASKRYGTVPGIKVKRRNRLLVAIDTSGSVMQAELIDFFTEIYFIWRQGAEITIVEADVKIHSIYKYNGNMPDIVRGGGGTDFNAVIDYANEISRPDGMIYFTDGYADIPKFKPRYPTLWVISHEGITEKDKRWDGLPGKLLKLN